MAASQPALKAGQRTYEERTKDVITATLDNPVKLVPTKVKNSITKHTWLSWRRNTKDRISSPIEEILTEVESTLFSQCGVIEADGSFFDRNALTGTTSFIKPIGRP